MIPNAIGANPLLVEVLWYQVNENHALLVYVFLKNLKANDSK